MSVLDTQSVSVPVGYQQITPLTAATALTVPARASYAVITVEGQPVRWRDDGTNPTASVGNPLPVGATLIYDGNLAAIKFIQTAVAGTINVAYYAKGGTAL